MEQPKKSRLLAYDVVRVTAILSVLLVHVSCYIVLYYANTSTKEFIFGNLLNGLSRAGVPLFLMLTGALLLNEDRPFSAKRFYRTSFVWMGLLLCGWVTFYGLFYSVAFPMLHHVPVEAAAAWKSFWNYVLRLPTLFPHLWYLFMVMGLYLMVPVLRLFVKRENRSYILGIIVAFVVANLAVNTLNLLATGWSFNFTTIRDKFHLEPLTGFVGFLLTGWYAANFKLKKENRLELYLLGAAAVVTATWMVRAMLPKNPSVRSFFYEPQTLTAFLYGLAVFVLILTLCGERQTKNRFLMMLSKCAFGAYILHSLYLELFTFWMPYWEFKPQNPLLYMALLFVADAVASYLTVWLVSLVPGLRKIFYLK